MRIGTSIPFNASHFTVSNTSTSSLPPVSSYLIGRTDTASPITEDPINANENVEDHQQMNADSLISNVGNNSLEDNSLLESSTLTAIETPLPFRSMCHTRSGFLFSLKFNKSDDPVLYYDTTPDDFQEMATLVVYTVGQPLYIVGCRDMAARWVFRHIEVESNLVKRLMLAKYHDSWAYTETQGQTQAFERARANLYVAKMLRHFQNALKHLWHMPGCDNVRAKLQAIHVAARALQVPPPFVLHTVGQATFSEPEWIYCETAVDDDNKRYVHAYKFHTAQHESDPWKDLIHGFIHFAYQKSEENSLIAQLDCDGDGIISNLVCYPKLSHLGPVSEYTETVDKAFQHFKGEHECNKICNILALRQLDDV